MEVVIVVVVCVLCESLCKYFLKDWMFKDIVGIIISVSVVCSLILRVRFLIDFKFFKIYKG